MAAKNWHILLTPYGCSPCRSLLTCAASLSPHLLTPWAETGQAGKGSTSTNPPYVVPNDWEWCVLSALLTYSRGQGPVALQLLCFYFPQSSPLHHQILQPGSWGCCCCETPLEGTSVQLLPLTPFWVTQPSARECGCDQGIAFFPPKPPAFSIFVLIPVAESTQICGWSQCCFGTWRAAMGRDSRILSLHY